MNEIFPNGVTGSTSGSGPEDVLGSNPSSGTFEKVKVLWGQGKKGVEIARLLGLSKATVSWHLAKLRPPIVQETTFPWEQIRQEYDLGKSVKFLRRKYGFSCGAWASAVRRKDVFPRSPKRIDEKNIQEYLVSDRPQTARHFLKATLIRLGLLKKRCSECGIGPEWNGKKLVLHLDHVNDSPKDNRLENLRLLCPNCHSQSETYAGRNIKKKVNSCL